MDSKNPPLYFSNLRADALNQWNAWPGRNSLCTLLTKVDGPTPTDGGPQRAHCNILCSMDQRLARVDWVLGDARCDMLELIPVYRLASLDLEADATHSEPMSKQSIQVTSSVDHVTTRQMYHFVGDWFSQVVLVASVILDEAEHFDGKNLAIEKLSRPTLSNNFNKNSVNLIQKFANNICKHGTINREFHRRNFHLPHRYEATDWSNFIEEGEAVCWPPLGEVVSILTTAIDVLVTHLDKPENIEKLRKASNRW